MVTAIADALAELDRHSTETSDGVWLEAMTAAVGTLIKDWDLSECWRWADWPDRMKRRPGTTRRDPSIDVVGVRKDGALVAIQCKSRQLDAHGRGADISKETKVARFLAASSDQWSNDPWADKWFVVNGDVDFSPQVKETIAAAGSSRPPKIVNLAADLRYAAEGTDSDDGCEHCEPDAGADAVQSRSCMQKQAVDTAVALLREHVDTSSGGLPEGQARGKITLPCGTGKTRISLQIAERLVPEGGLAVVLCPSIALIAQIRREYLHHAEREINALAVCSDKTAGHDHGRVPAEDADEFNVEDDPTLDVGMVGAAAVKGPVTTDPGEIAQWITVRGRDRLNVIFGTYQSSHRIGEALNAAGVCADVVICDEAHRTAGLRRRKGTEQRVRDFTVCHDQTRFPARFRVYQTATPKVYYTGGNRPARSTDEWIVRSMDDETVFGVELYRRPYKDAVRNRWLADYRIVAVAVDDPEADRVALALARAAEQQHTKGTGKGKALNAAQFAKGMVLAVALSGGAGPSADDGQGRIDIKSCIAFMNTVAKSKSMAKMLTESREVKDWITNWMTEHHPGHKPADFALEHLDASSRVTQRDEAKARLAAATAAYPHGVVNVGIFGEGTDSPNLSAVAFLEPRKSPIDVIQAVGRAMRATPGKDLGYIICPVTIPAGGIDAETFLRNSSPGDGWQELGQVLCALRAHDDRFEENLADLMVWRLPAAPPETEPETTIVAAGSDETQRYHIRAHVGPRGSAERDMAAVARGTKTLASVTQPLQDVLADAAKATATERDTGTRPEGAAPEPHRILTARRSEDPDGNTEVELRESGVPRQPTDDNTLGPVNQKETRRRTRRMINNGDGRRIGPTRSRSSQDRIEDEAQRLFDVSGLGDEGHAVYVNLLEKSGLSGDRMARDANILEATITEAAHHLRSECLTTAMNRHFGLDALGADKLRDQADGCTIAALLMMNASMLHQRIAAGGWLHGIDSPGALKSSVDVIRDTERSWQDIRAHDFRPVVEPALAAMHAVESTGKTAGLERALRHLAAEAERLAETYADMGADHAGPLFNKVMGNQASDGAYFTRPVAAQIAARLALDACAGGDWSDPAVWRDHKTVDLACGSGTLLAAVLSDMKRRARDAGANRRKITELQRLAVEGTIKGFDINPVSLQLAASQLIQGNQDIRYKQMGLHLMPYGPEKDKSRAASAGTLELIGQRRFLDRPDELELEESELGDAQVWEADDVELEDAVEAAQDARIVIMNPPFTNRSKMGEKFRDAAKQALRKRTDYLNDTLVADDASVNGVLDKNSVRPVFATLGERCLTDDDGAVLAMISPTILATNASGLAERRWLASRLHLHTVLTNFATRDGNLSQNTEVNESVFVFRRCHSASPTRVIALDRFPRDEHDTDAALVSAVHPEGNTARRMGRGFALARRSGRGRGLDRRGMAVPRTRQTCRRVRRLGPVAAPVGIWPVGLVDRPDAQRRVPPL